MELDDKFLFSWETRIIKNLAQKDSNLLKTINGMYLWIQRGKTIKTLLIIGQQVLIHYTRNPFPHFLCYHVFSNMTNLLYFNHIILNSIKIISVKRVIVLGLIHHRKSFGIHQILCRTSITINRHWFVIIKEDSLSSLGSLWSFPWFIVDLW